MPSYTTGSKPTTAYQSMEDVAKSFLLINLTDFLLINASGDRLFINDTRDSGFTSDSKPSTSYTSPARPS